MATLIGWLANCGSRLADGTPNASGTVQAYVPGTTTFAAVYGDAAETAPLPQPIALDAAGRATVYANSAVDLLFQDSTGAALSLQSTANGINAKAVEVENLGFTGTDSNGNLVAGVKTSLDAVLSSIATSLGGVDGNYQESPGATGIPIATALRDIAISVRSFGAKGDGSADDTSAIQKTVNEVARLNGGIVYFPPGTYIISSAITIPNKNGISIVGANYRTSIVKQINAAADGFDSISSFNVSFSNLQITCSGANTGSAINSITSFTRIDSVFVPSSPAFAFGLTVSSAAAELFVTNSNIFGTTRGALINGSGPRLIATDFSSNTYGVEFASSHGITIVGGSYAGTTKAVLFSGTSSGALVVGCSDGFMGFSAATDPGLTQFGNLLDGTTVDVLSGASVTPDLLSGNEFRIRGTTVGANYTVNVPTPTPTRRGVRITLHLFNNATVNVTGWTLAAGYHQATGAAAISLVDLHHTMLTFEFDLDAGVWRELGQRTDST